MGCFWWCERVRKCAFCAGRKCKSIWEKSRKWCRKSAIVAIDFGTKSTVAIYRDNAETIYPLEIGSNSANENYKEKNFENPTMIEFGDFEEF